MITPLEIEQKQFTKSMRGYNDKEVDAFLNAIILEMENLIKENNELRDENHRIKDELSSSKSTEGQILDTLETAKKLMNDISASAEKRAEVLLKNAELDADLMKREAKETVERLTDESKELRSRMSTLREKYKNLLETELERFDTLSSELFLDADDLVKSLPEVENEPVPADTIVVKNVSDLEEPEKPVDMTKTMVNIR